MVRATEANRCSYLDGAPEMHRVVCDQAGGVSLEADEGCDHAENEVAPEFEHRCFIAECFDERANVVDAPAILRDQMLQHALVRAYRGGCRVPR